jgi:hypothetical protein
MWAYVWSVRRHLSPPWEDEDGFGGEVRAVRDQECECVLCVCVCSPPRPLLLLLMGDGGFGATLALLTYPNLFLFLIT